MALDSDLNNPDSALVVEFYNYTVLNRYMSDREGRPVHEDVVMIKIEVPGNQTLQVVRPVEEHDKRRFPLQWAVFQNAQTSESQEVGTPLSELPGLSKAQAENLRVAKFYTIEQVAAASDQALQSLLMKLGMAPEKFRERCQRYLAAAEEKSPYTRLEAEIADRDARLAALEAQLKSAMEAMSVQQEQIAMLSEQQPAQKAGKVA